MRSLFLVLLLVGSAHGLFGTISTIVGGVTNTLTAVTNGIGQTASNLWNGATGAVGTVVGNVVDSAGNVVGQLVNTANGVQFAANFLWDNVFGPAYDMFVEGKAKPICNGNLIDRLQVDNCFSTINSATSSASSVVDR